ncbi:aromatic ring-hydroxylating dioxygenase subunit alpha [Aeromicrobium sp. Root344]|uniref:aromatic ring-hydroxylating dioxygenase subunit alpha n=1 Tax=Aeromicrobium sp. Root344 TaxID=1736521 RepID=UPI0009E74BB6|nr:aromatic ring-hydroxylating dioxygenase subunit alpha [Aeromicrobium sp. Root344]
MIRSAERARRDRLDQFPLNCWYVAAAAEAVTRTPIRRRIADMPIVLYRAESGVAVALIDKCAHRGYPLSRGHVDGDNIVDGYHGFTYGPDGRCIRVPSQSHVPFGAEVRAFPVVELNGFVWLWPGSANASDGRTPPELPWLEDPSWRTVAGEDEVEANFLLLHENFADITHVPVVAPDIAPAVLLDSPPPLEVKLNETTVTHVRSFPRSPLAPWHAGLLGVSPEEQHVQTEEGSFVGPGLWIDSFDVRVADSESVPAGLYHLRFVQAVTPRAVGSTGLIWRLSRNFAVNDTRVSQQLEATFRSYYTRVKDVLEILQSSNDRDPLEREVHVSADAAALEVRRIIRAMLIEQGETPLGSIATRTRARVSRDD